MIDNLIAALKISLAECAKYEEADRYIYEVNQVLNRYKTNLFKSVKDPYEHLYDPKEFIHFRICGSYRTNRGWGDEALVQDAGPTLLYVYGFFPTPGERINKERVYHKTVQIDDVIRKDFIHHLYNDQYRKHEREVDAVWTEQKHFEDKMGGFIGLCSIHFYQEFSALDLKTFNWQINSMVHPSVMREYNEASANRMAVGEITRWGKTDAEREAARLKKEGRNPVKPYKVKGGIRTCFLSGE